MDELLQNITHISISQVNSEISISTALLKKGFFIFWVESVEQKSRNPNSFSSKN